MQITAQSGYAHLAQYQQPRAILPIEEPVTTPVEPKPPVTIPEYEKPTLDPEKAMELQDRLEEAKSDLAASEEAKRDEIRQLAVGYTAIQSKKSQFEIYMTGTTEENPSTVKFMQTLRDIQEQNNTIKAYAAYQENALQA